MGAWGALHRPQHTQGWIKLGGHVTATLCVGYAAALALHAAALARRPQPGLGLRLLPLLPAYWLLTAWALLVGLSDLAVRPHRWAKTAHGVARRPEGAPGAAGPRQDG